MKKAYVFLADGFEEIEGLTVVDVLRRAGAEVEMVSVMDRKEITGAHGIKVEADRMIEEAGEADLYVLPGGMPGTLHLKEHAGLCRLLNQAEKKEKHIAAICAAPSVLGELGMLKGKRACCYPSFEEKLNCLEVSYEPVVKDHDISGNGNCRQVFTGTGECFIWKGKSRRNSRIYRICVKNTGNMVTFMLY